MRHYILLSILFFLDNQGIAYCPLILGKHKLNDLGVHLNPAATRAYTYEKGWIPQDMEVLYLDDRNLPIPKADVEDAASFQFMLRDSVGGMQAPATVKAPCEHRKQLEIAKGSDPKKSYVYLFWCKNPLQAEPKPAFVHKENTNVFEGKYFSYRYNKRNNMLFDDIWVQINDERKQVARNATLQIRVDIKNFFTLNFSTEDIESKIFETFSGPVALISHMMFYLRVLFFKINLELKTALLLFDHNVEIPMVLHMPVHAYKWVRPGSGLFYSWESNKDEVSYDLAQSSITIFDENKIKSGANTLGEQALARCGPSEKCTFTLVLKSHGKPVSITFMVPRALVSRGFYPQFVPDLIAAQTQLEYPVSKKAEQGWDRVGVYFENSGTEKGEHLWNFGISIDDVDRNFSCVDQTLILKQR